MYPKNADITNEVEIESSSYVLEQMNWVEGQIQKMTPDERIGQLFMVASYSNKDEAHKKSIDYIINKYKIGGLIFFQGTPEKQVELTNHYQSLSKTPLLVAIDGEWGLSMRLKNTTKFPRQLTLGAIQNNELIYDMGAEIARQCKRMGIHVNLAPVVDVNNNRNNPVINDRSFGEDKYNVAEKGVAYMQGMEKNGILACAKHFPGHGDTDADSHYTLPVIKHSVDRLYDIELYPFRELIKNKVSGMMVAHLAVPSLDSSPMKASSTTSMPTTLSKNVVTNLLKNELGYNGLIFTDALNMKGVSAHFEPGDVDARALLAGNDVLLFPENVGNAITEIKKAITQGQITQSEIDNRVRKILKAKYQAGLHNYQPVSTVNLDAELNTPEATLLKRKLIENAITVAKNDLELLPFKDLEHKSFAAISIGASTLTEFQKTLGNYSKFRHYTVQTSESETRYNQIFDAVRNFSTVVIGIHGMGKSSSNNYGLSSSALNFIQSLERYTNVVLVVFGSPYSLSNFDMSQTVVAAYEDDNLTQSIAAQMLFGAISARGKLPVSASSSFQFGQGIYTMGGMRLKYTQPEDIGIRSSDLAGIDKIANEAISSKAAPGCQVLVAKDGHVIFQKSYGYHTYDRKKKVENNDLYDLASITKISASLMGIMNMYESGYLNLYGMLSQYLPEVASTNKRNLVIKDILLHESGLKAWIPFYKETIPMRYSLYSSDETSMHSIPVAKNMYMRNDYVNNMMNTIHQSELKSRGRYKYSDVGYYYFKQMIERYSGESLDQFVDRNYYRPLGMNTMCYNPHERFSSYSIVPTENDREWRNQLVHGYVHDMGAAMMGGVGGHAGVFSNANDLAILMQMLLNKGTYGGRTYFNGETVDQFTKKQKSGNRRGLGFDKPEFDSSKSSPTGKYVSSQTFGHTGFTGTCVWADPQNDLIYVFLSNRVYPSSTNRKLLSKDIRTRIHDVIYQAVAKMRPVQQYHQSNKY